MNDDPFIRIHLELIRGLLYGFFERLMPSVSTRSVLGNMHEVITACARADDLKRYKGRKLTASFGINKGVLSPSRPQMVMSQTNLP